MQYTEKNHSLNSCQKLVNLTSFALSRWRWQNRRVLPRQWQVISQKLVTPLSESCQEMHDKEDLSIDLISQKFVIFLSNPCHRTLMAAVSHGQFINALISKRHIMSLIQMSYRRHGCYLSCLPWEVAHVHFTNIRELRVYKESRNCTSWSKSWHMSSHIKKVFVKSFIIKFEYRINLDYTFSD